MTLEEQLTVGIYLIIAAFLSALIGMDREKRDKSAGLRTHMLIGIGACLFTALSEMAFAEADTARVAAQVVTGVGFIGAGVIYKGEEQVHDLTTAAAIWTTAAIGMTVGVGAWFLATLATVLVWFVLRVIWYIYHK